MGQWEDHVLVPLTAVLQQRDPGIHVVTVAPGQCQLLGHVLHEAVGTLEVLLPDPF